MKPKQHLAVLAAFVVGLYATWRVAIWLAWRQAGLDRAVAAGSADCDQCGLTVLLDQIGFVLGCFAVYFIVVGTISSVWRRRDRRPAP